MQLLTHKEIKSIRHHDMADAREAGSIHWDRYRRLLRGEKFASTGATAPGCPPGIFNSADGGIVQGHRGPACPTPACADVLGFNTLNVANFPVAGGGVGVVTATPVVTVTSGNGSAFKATAIFFEGRDAANALANVVCLLSNVQVSGIDQLVDNGNTAGITSAVFALTNNPLPVGWDPFMDRGQKLLSLTFANILAAAVTLEIFGVMWGSRID